MRAVVLAGGKGVRLLPYTTILPKPLVPLGDRSVVEIVLMRLRASGIKRVTMAVSHLADLIMAYFGNGEKWGLEIDYSLEDKPLSTIAPLKLIDDLPETFFVTNADVLTDLDLTKLYNYHLDNDNDVTVATFERDNKIDFGVIETDQADRIIGFREKPVYHFRVSMGVYVLSRRILDIVPDDTAFGFDDLMHACIEKQYKAASYPHTGLWLDIGRPGDYEEASENCDKLMEALLPGDPRLRP